MTPRTPSSHVPSPFDADAALRSLRPRLHAARARQRRMMGGSAMALTLLVGGVGVATVRHAPTTAGQDTVLAGAPDDLLDGLTDPTAAAPGDGTGAGEGSAGGDGNGSTDAAGSTTDAALPPAPVEVPPEAAVAPPPPAPAGGALPPPPPPAPPAPAPTTPPAPPPAPTSQLHTFHYDGAGSIVVELRGRTLTLVSATPVAGWTATPHNGQDYVKVEFRKDNVSRWLKVRLESGVLVAYRWEDVRPMCSLAQGTTVHAAPGGAGTVAVTVSGTSLQLGTITPAPGWTPEIRHALSDSIKVKFWNAGLGKGVWIEIKVRDCQVKVSTGWY